MKALREMNNTQRAYEIARLFPQDLKALTLFIKSEIAHFREKEEATRQAWPEQCSATADYWFDLIQSAEDIIAKFSVTLFRNPRVFADQFFYAHNAVFAIHCLVRYASSGKAPYLLRTAITLYFGEEEIVTIDFNTDKL